MNPEERKNHCYLGDGVYAELTSNHVILRTGDHRDQFCDNKIYLEEDVIHSFFMWLECMNKRNKQEQTTNEPE